MWNIPDDISASAPMISITSPLLKDTFYSLPFLKNTKAGVSANTDLFNCPRAWWVLLQT